MQWKNFIASCVKNAESNLSYKVKGITCREMDIDIHRFAQKLFPFIWLKHGLISSLPPPGFASPKKITVISNNIGKAVLVYSYAFRPLLKQHLERHRRRMAESKIAFLTHVAFLCLKIRLQKDNLFDYFLSTCSIMSESALFCNSTRLDEVHSYASIFFKAFFQSNLSQSFYESGGWECLMNYVDETSCLELYESMQQYVSEMASPCDLLPAMVVIMNEDLIAGRREKLLFSRKLSEGEIERDESAKLLAAEIFDWEFMEEQHVSDPRPGVFKRTANIRHKNTKPNILSRSDDTRRKLFEVGGQHLQNTQNFEVVNSDKKIPLKCQVDSLEMKFLLKQRIDTASRGSPVKVLGEKQISVSRETTTSDEECKESDRRHIIFTKTVVPSTDFQNEIRLKNSRLAEECKNKIFSTGHKASCVLNTLRSSEVKEPHFELIPESIEMDDMKGNACSHSNENDSPHILSFRKMEEYMQKRREKCNESRVFPNKNATAEYVDYILNSQKMKGIDLNQPVNGNERYYPICIPKTETVFSTSNSNFRTDESKEKSGFFCNIQKAHSSTRSSDNGCVYNTKSQSKIESSGQGNESDHKLTLNDNLNYSGTFPKRETFSNGKEVSSKVSTSSSLSNLNEPIDGTLLKPKQKMLNEVKYLDSKLHESTTETVNQCSNKESESVWIKADGKVYYKKKSRSKSFDSTKYNLKLSLPKNANCLDRIVKSKDVNTSISSVEQVCKLYSEPTEGLEKTKFINTEKKVLQIEKSLQNFDISNPVVYDI